MPVLPRQDLSYETGVPIPRTPILTGMPAHVWMRKEDFVQLGWISLVFLLAPFIIWRVVWLISSWGWWKPANPSNSHYHRHYVRTWHGWVTAEHHEHHVTRKKTWMKKFQKKLAWKSSTADYSWIFWDPTGEGRRAYENRKGPLERWLPKWTRSWEFGSMRWRRGNGKQKLEDIERGVAQPQPTQASVATKSNTQHGGLLNQRRGRAARASSSEMGSVSTGISAQQSETVRIRPAATRRVTAWVLRSSEDESVSREPVMTYLDTDIRFTTTPSTELEASSPTSRRAVTEPIEGGSSRYTLSTTRSMPALVTRIYAGKPASLLDSSSTGEAQEPDDAEEIPTPRGFTPISGELAPLYRGFPYSPVFAERLDCSLHAWEKPMVLNPFHSTGPKWYGIAGRNNSPTMGWVHFRAASESDIEEMHARKPPRDPLRRRSDSSLIDNWTPYPKRHVIDFGRALECLGKRPERRWSRVTTKSRLERIASGEPEEQPTPGISSGSKWYEKYKYGHLCAKDGHGPRPSSNAILDREITASSRAAPAGRSVSLILSPTHGSPPLPFSTSSSHVASPFRNMSLPEKSFLDALERKLTWLSFELSPGFRGPEDNPAEMLVSPYARTKRFSANVVSRATEPQKRMCHPSRNKHIEGPNDKGALVPVRRRLQLPQIEGWRSDVNELRSVSGTDEKLPEKVQFEGEAPEPYEGDIDTSAWILPRPPQGWPPSTSGINSYYTGVQGYPERMWKWETIRRPYVLEMLIKRHHARHLRKRGNEVPLDQHREESSPRAGEGNPAGEAET